MERYQSKFAVGEFIEVLECQQFRARIKNFPFRAKVLKVNYLPYINYLVKELYTPSPPVWVMEYSIRELSEEEEAYHIQAGD